jgi:hypothetical protein
MGEQGGGNNSRKEREFHRRQPLLSSPLSGEGRSDRAWRVRVSGLIGLFLKQLLRMGNHVTLIAGFRSADLLFWTKENERVEKLQAEFGERLDVIYSISNL